MIVNALTEGCFAEEVWQGLDVGRRVGHSSIRAHTVVCEGILLHISLL